MFGADNAFSAFGGSKYTGKSYPDVPDWLKKINAWTKPGGEGRRNGKK